MKTWYSMKWTFPIMLVALFGATTSLWAGESFFSKFKSDFKKSFLGEDSGSQQPQSAEAASAANNRNQPQSKLLGTVTKGSNVRSGPGTKNAKIGMVPKGSVVTITSAQGGWYAITAEVNGKPTQGWIYAPLVDVNKTSAMVVPGKPGETEIATTAAGKASPSNVSYAGYSKEFLPIKEMMGKGDLDGVERFYANQETAVREKYKDESDLLEKIGFLRWLERGTLSIDQGQFDDSVENFSSAERLMDMRQQQSKVADWGETAFKFIGEMSTGNQEFQDYPGEGYERVLMLNYKSIAYLLQGQRKAYNVTRRAIDWQNVEKKAFEKKIREVEKELAEQKEKTKEEQNKSVAPLTDSRVSEDYAKMNAKAATVPSAYVNPFGYYVAGMIQEFESYDDRSLRDNAKISYKKALELNPASKVLKKAVKDMENPTAPAGSRLVHIVVADGFVPEKKMLTYQINASGGSIPIKLTLYEPDPSPVSRIEVQTTGGKRLAVLSPIADVEAICLRNQMDMEPFRQLKVAVTVASSVVAQGVLTRLGVIGNVIAKKRNEMAAPDMRSWMSLPATIQATRLRLKKGISKIKIVSKDRKGRTLASKVVDINRNSHDFVYSRSINKAMYAYSAKKLWMLASN